MSMTNYKSANKDWFELHEEKEARLKAGEITPERREIARFMRRMVDLWEAGKLGELEWSARLERLQPQGPQYYAWQGHYSRDPWRARYRIYVEKNYKNPTGPIYDWIPDDRPPTRTEATWNHGVGGLRHEFENAFSDISEKVGHARCRWIQRRHDAEQARRLDQLIRDWIGPRSRRPTRKVAAKRYGASEGKCRQIVAEWRKKNPCGPKGERRRRGG